MTIFSRIDHAAAAAEFGMTLRPTEVITFGNPKAGTLLMQLAQTIGIDLPLRALVWQDDQGKTWLSYNDLTWLGDRQGLGSEATATLEPMAHGLAKVSNHATGAAP